MQLVGFALFFFTYSTWEGKCVFMEDLYVQPEQRGKGIGTKVKIATKKSLTRIHILCMAVMVITMLMLA